MTGYLQAIEEQATREAQRAQRRADLLRRAADQLEKVEAAQPFGYLPSDWDAGLAGEIAAELEGGE